MGLRRGVSPGKHAFEDQIDDQLATLITQVTGEVTWYMRERGITRADLAGRMGVSPGRVSQILSGGENLTLRSLAGLATALDARIEVDFAPRESLAQCDDASQDLEATEVAVAEDIRPLPSFDQLEEVTTSVGQTGR